MLKQRVVTAIVLVALMLTAIFYFPPLWFSAFVALIIIQGAWEWSALAGIKTRILRFSYLLVVILAMGLCYRQTSSQRELLLLAGCLWWVLAYFLIRRYPSINLLWKHPLALSVVGLMVLLPGWSALLSLRSSPHYVALIMLLLGMVAAADIGAYFTGRAFGKTKLAPQVSPNKTWEGFFGGMFCSCLLAMLVLYFSHALPVMTALLVLKILAAALSVAILSVVGDLFESMIKRQANVKDSGSLLPGHGGVLDRIDSITAALPLFVLALGMVPL